MRIRCTYCDKPVSTQVPVDFSLRAVVICPECTREREKLCDKCKAVLKRSDDEVSKGVRQQ
jgi:hypothetical protein